MVTKIYTFETDKMFSNAEMCTVQAICEMIGAWDRIDDKTLVKRWSYFKGVSVQREFSYRKILILLFCNQVWKIGSTLSEVTSNYGNLLSFVSNLTYWESNYSNWESWESNFINWEFRELNSVNFVVLAISDNRSFSFFCIVSGSKR